MIQDDYDVLFLHKKYLTFINRNKPIQYWAAIEPDSRILNYETSERLYYVRIPMVLKNTDQRKLVSVY